MKVRVVGLLAILAVALGLLSSCRTNVGVAARIDGQTIKENTIGDYLIENAPTPAATASASETVAPRVLVVLYLVRRAVLARALAKDGGTPSTAALATVRTRAEQAIGGSTGTSAAFANSLSGQLKQAGLEQSFAPVYYDYLEMTYLLAVRERLSSLNELPAAVAKAKISVRINPRFGTWVPAQFGVNANGSTPGYLTLQSTASPTGS